MEILALSIPTDFKKNRAHISNAPSDRKILFRVIAFLIENIDLIENFLSALETDSMLNRITCIPVI